MKLLQNKKIFGSPYFYAGLITIIVIIITLQGIYADKKEFYEGGIKYPNYNNYVIFKTSFLHLLNNQNLYDYYWDEHWDLYKYSPTFALLMAPFAFMPDFAGLFAWNLLNGLVFFFAIWLLPIKDRRKTLLIILIVIIELITSMQSSQSNALVAGLIILAFNFLEKNKIGWAALFVVLTFYIKIFGIVALVLFLFYPGKLKAFFYTVFWLVVLFFLPLIIISPNDLIAQYQNWFYLLRNDHSESIGISVAGWLSSWFDFKAKNIILLTGTLLLCLPLIRYKNYSFQKFRLFFLSTILIWVVIFNHKAESTTFIIAVSGIVIWFFSGKITPINLALLILTVILTILSPTDLFPKSVRNNYIVPYALKALPCILIWLKITIELLLYKKENFIEN